MNTLAVQLRSIGEKAMLSAVARDNSQVIIDYFPPVGTGQGYTSLELLLASFGSCVSTTVLTLLRYRMKKKIDGVAIDVEGIVRENHPKAFERIKAVLRIRAYDLTEPETERALKIAEEELCPVWAMLRGNAVIDVAVEIESPR